MHGWPHESSPRQRQQAELFYRDLIGHPPAHSTHRSDLGEAIDVDDPRRKTFRQMWDLLTRFRWRETPAMFTNELMIAICWEESTFMNIWQVGKNGGKGPAKGYGQLEPSALGLIRAKFGLKPSIAALQRLMDADAFSISFIGRALHTLHDNMLAASPALRNSPARLKRRVLLYGYGGYGADPAQWRIDAINGWYAAEQKLLGHRGPSGYPTRTAAIAALDAATPPKRKMKDHAAWQRFLAKICQSLPDP